MKNGKKKQKYINLLVFLVLLIISVVFVFAFPTITEVLTPNGITSNLSILIQYNISQDDSLSPSSIKFSWNNSNHTFYDDSLVLFMNFDNRSSLGEDSTKVVDLSKYGNNGTIYSNVSGWDDGKYGGAYLFNGSYNGRIDIPQTASLKVANISFTMSAWVKINNNQGDNDRIIAGNWNNPGYYMIYSTLTNGVLCYNGNATASARNPVGSVLLNNNEWTLVTCVYNGSYMNSYKNGFPSGSGTIFINVTTDSGHFSIGGYDSGSGIWNGSIDDVMIWNRTLSDSEIEELYYSSLTKINEQNWTIIVNQSLSHGTKSYYLCSSNSTGDEICSATQSITQETCTYLGSGNWNIDCSDNCIWDSNQNILNNITMTGTGVLTLNSNFSFLGTNQFIFQNSGCELDTNIGGGFT